MKRLQLTTVNKVVFLSPFVYSDRTAKLKLKRFKWLVRNKAKLETVDVENYPKFAVYDKDRVRPIVIKMIEKKWKEIQDG